MKALLVGLGPLFGLFVLMSAKKVLVCDNGTGVK